MPKYVCIAAHISIGELENRYRKATDPVERSHFQIIWLLAQGKRVREVSEVTGDCANWSEDSGSSLHSKRASGNDGPATAQSRGNTFAL